MRVGNGKQELLADPRQQLDPRQLQLTREPEFRDGEEGVSLRVAPSREPKNLLPPPRLLGVETYGREI
jgi:hypothetical protein